MAEIDSANVMGLIYASKKYLIPELTKMCFVFLDKELSSDNACLILRQAILFDEMGLVDKCLKFIDNNAEEVFASEDFLNLDQRTLNLLLARDTLCIKESRVFQAVNRWSEEECRKREYEVTIENKRAVMGEALYLIRMSAMIPEEFVEGPIESGVLNDKEALAVVTNFHRKESLKTPFANNVRQLKVYKRFRTTDDTPEEANRYNTICLSSDKKVWLHGLSVYGYEDEGYKMSITISLKTVVGDEIGEKIMTEKFVYQSHGKPEPYRCIFKQPVLLPRSSRYHASVTYEEEELCYWHGVTYVPPCYWGYGFLETMQGDVTFSFTKLPDYDDDPIEYGKIQEIIFRS